MLIRNLWVFSCYIYFSSSQIRGILDTYRPKWKFSLNLNTVNFIMCYLQADFACLGKSLRLRGEELNVGV